MIAGSRSRRSLLALVVGTQFAICIDATIMNMALPSIGRDLAVDAGTLSWVTTAYVLTFGGFLLLGGRLVDLFGHSRALIAGFLLFGAGSLAGSVAGDAAALISARAVQGLGAALLAPAAVAALVLLFREGERRNRAFAMLGVAAAASVPCGALFGGLLTATLGWQSVLWINVPLCLVGATITARSGRLPRRGFGDLDAAGAVTATAGLSLLLYALVAAPHSGWTSAGTLALFACAGVLLGAFVRIELRARRPVLSPRLLRTGSIGAANAVALIASTAMFGMIFVLTLYLQRSAELSPLEAGIAFLPYGLAEIASMALAPALVRAWGAELVVVLGCAGAAVALLPLTVVPAEDGYLHVLAAILLLGVGNGLFFVALNVCGLTGVQTRDAGMAGSLLNASQQLGGAVGLAATVTVYSVVAASSSSQAATQRAFQLDAALAAAAALLAAFCLLRRRG